MSDAPATFLFADIAGFTALTEAHGDEQAVALVDAFWLPWMSIYRLVAPASSRSVMQ